MREHQVHFDAILRESMAAVTGAFDDVASTVKDIKGGKSLAMEMLLTHFAHDLQRRIDRSVHKSIDEMWQKFDTSGDGALQKTEMRELVRSVFTDIKGNLAALVKCAMQPATEDLLGWIDSDATGPFAQASRVGGAHLALELSVQKSIEDASSKLYTLLNKLVDGLLGSTGPVSDEIFDEVDVDKDGKVSKAEFTEGFGEALGSVLDFSRIVKLFIRDRQNSQQILSRSSTSTFGGSPLIGMLFGFGMAAVFAGLGYMVFARKRHFMRAV